jgi:hypothetical protein
MDRYVAALKGVDLKVWYGTFGTGIDQPNRKLYVQLTAPTQLEAENFMWSTFHRDWCRVYPSELFHDAIERWELQLGYVAEWMEQGSWTVQQLPRR